MSALRALDRTPLEVSVKCEPQLALHLRGTYAAIRPGDHLNKRHWNTVTLAGSLPDTLISDLVEDSYDLVVTALPKRTRKRLGWAPEAGASRGGALRQRAVTAASRATRPADARRGSRPIRFVLARRARIGRSSFR